MSFLRTTFNILTEKRDIKETIIYKEFNDRDTFLLNLKLLSESNDSNIDTKKAENHLKMFSIGQMGEKSVFFELQNSLLPMLILHDINIEHEGLQAQLDFVIVTHKFILILEVKKLFGNIKVNDRGDFQREITSGNRVVKKEGMYNPLNQVERHATILEKYLKANGIIKNCPVRFAVTFANPKTIINISKQAPSDIQNRVLRHDQIKTFLKEELKKDSPVFMLDSVVYKIANFIKDNNKEHTFKLENYYKQMDSLEENRSDIKSQPEFTLSPDQLRERLKEFRLNRSRELNVKPFYIFTNKTLDLIIDMKPLTIQELLKIDGIGPKKAEDFGHDIINIIKG